MVTPPVTGMEYTIIPDGNPYEDDDSTIAPPKPGWFPAPGSQEPYTWGDVTFNDAEPIPLKGFRVAMRYRVVSFRPGKPSDPITGNPGTEDNYTYTYPTWELVEQSLEITNRPKGTVFETDDGDETFVASEGAYGIATAGITDNKKYAYPGVFDETVAAYIEPLSPYNSTPVEDKTIPTQPYDESQGVYPIDTMTSFKPDTRPTVILEYTLTTKFSLRGRTITDVINILHPVHQDIGNWEGVVREYVDRSYFTNGRIPWKLK